MTRYLATFVTGLAIGALLTGFLCKRRTVQAYMVYGEKAVSELETQANERKAVKGLST